MNQYLKTSSHLQKKKRPSSIKSSPNSIPSHPNHKKKDLALSGSELSSIHSLLLPPKTCIQATQPPATNNLG
ncbi:hypothetical protein OROMI_012494 [Orobanche minor]